ncbi:MAG: biotin transporter BioY [Clostridia bacterium]|nr:biotin transporter BioY [Clostridia bacterium]
MNIKKTETIGVITAALFTALMAVFAQIPPSTHEFPITLQTFGIALCGYILGIKYSFFSIAAYILLGIAGAPVFSGFCGGVHHITGPAGGFVMAFPILVFFCAFSLKFKSKIFKISFGVIGLVIMYIIGIAYYIFVTKTPFWTAILMYALLFLKDVFFTVIAFFVSNIIRKRILNKK